MPNHAHIYLSEHGAQVLCPATKQAYMARGARWEVIGEMVCVWSECPLCDTAGRHPDDVGFAPNEPQPHLHCLGVHRADT